MNKQKGFAVTGIIILLVVIGIVVGGFWFILHATKSNNAHVNKAFHVQPRQSTN